MKVIDLSPFTDEAVMTEDGRGGCGGLSALQPYPQFERDFQESYEKSLPLLR